MKSIKSACFLLFIGIFPCAAQESSTNRPWITVFVHGNYGAGWVALGFDSVLRDNCEGSWYKKMQTWSRLHNLAHKKIHDPRLYPAFGLHKIDLCKPVKEKNSDPIPYALAKTYQDITALIDPQEASNTTYYSFGWNGMLSQTARRLEAIAFYQALSQEVALYKKRGLKPRARVICHSHGGNVISFTGGINAVLNNEQFHDSATKASLDNIAQEIKNLQVEKMLDPELCVDELIILATPIQKETEGFFASKFFKKVLTGYSNNDFVQIIDGVSTNGPVSNRTITKQKLGQNTREIHYSVVKHSKEIRPNPLAMFIKKKLKASLLLGQNVMKQITKFYVSHAKMPEEKILDLHALDEKIQEMQLNMLLHPDDPSHGDFFNARYEKKQQIVQTLPLFVWTPLVCQLLQQLKCFDDNNPNDLQVTFHYHDETITIVAETATEEKNFVVPANTLLDLKKKFFGYLIDIENDFLI